MKAAQFQAITELVLPTSSVTLLVIGGLEFTGTNFVYDKSRNLVSMVRTSDNVRLNFDGDAVYGFTYVPPPPSA